MRFGIILDGGNRPGQSREEAFLERLETARQAKRHGFHSLWVGQGYLHNGWHATALLARVAAEAPGMELGVEELILRCQWPGMPGEEALRAVQLFGRDVLPKFSA